MNIIETRNIAPFNRSNEDRIAYVVIESLKIDFDYLCDFSDATVLVLLNCVYDGLVILISSGISGLVSAITRGLRAHFDEV